MQEYNLIGINMESVSTSVNYFAETGIFQTIPMIVYTINDNRTKEFHIERPIKLFYKNMSYKDFESIVKTDGTGLDFMAMPGKAYQRMQYYINRNVEKVLADMFVSIIVEILKELKEEKENIFFINNRESDKVIGLKGADVHLCLIAAIGFQHVFCQSQFRCDLLNGEHGCALGDLDITFHVHNRASIHKNYKRSETGGECRVLTFVTLMDPGLPDHQ